MSKKTSLEYAELHGLQLCLQNSVSNNMPDDVYIWLQSRVEYLKNK